MRRCFSIFAILSIKYGRGGIRTHDLILKRDLLYQLSYTPISEVTILIKISECYYISFPQNFKWISLKISMIKNHLISRIQTLYSRHWWSNGALTEWSIVQVCKTSVHGFESHGRLISLCLALREQSVLYTTSDELYGSRKLYESNHIAFLFCLKSDFFYNRKNSSLKRRVFPSE